VTAQSTWKKSIASMVAACMWRNLRQFMSVRRFGAGDPQRPEDAADGGCADAVAELEQLALDPLVSPAVILGGEPPDECGDLCGDRWPALRCG
jgi:hypothetical protein